MPKWESESVYDWSKDGYTREREERSKIIGRLLAEGWEPIQVENGEVSVFKRVIPETR
ncbi:MAG: hypothetical protein HY868_21415 [Chloroflexi bacterium]|nr:hypothetical protein [Chloroflexota bacterium]